MIRELGKGRQSGFSLVEVMVSVLITSVSLLGMAGMQITSKRAGQEALQRTAATAMAMDILERMRSNPQALAAYQAAALAACQQRLRPQLVAKFDHGDETVAGTSPIDAADVFAVGTATVGGGGNSKVARITHRQTEGICPQFLTDWFVASLVLLPQHLLETTVVTSGLDAKETRRSPWDYVWTMVCG